MHEILMTKLTVEELSEKVLSNINPKLDKLIMLVSPQDPEELLTPKETASLLKVDLSTIHNWWKKGKLKKYAKGNRTYYKRSEVINSIKPI